jgi:hypothetical protein
MIGKTAVGKRAAEAVRKRPSITDGHQKISMSNTSKRSIGPRRKERPKTGKRVQAKLISSRPQKVEERRQKAKQPEKELGNKRARAELERLVAGKLCHRYDSLYLASKLFAVAVQEARTFLDQTALMMALVGIGMMDETDDPSNLYDKIESILMEVPNNAK